MVIYYGCGAYTVALAYMCVYMTRRLCIMVPYYSFWNGYRLLRVAPQLLQEGLPAARLLPFEMPSPLQ